jgi:hypothetical protein
LAISDTVHVVSLDRVADRANSESGDADDLPGSLDSGWDDGEVSPSGLRHSILLQTTAKQNFVLFVSY